MGADSSLAVWLPTKHYTAGNWKKTKITIHHTASKTTAEACARGHMARTGSSRASANYYIGYDGSCVQAVAEKDRSWCSGDAKNDYNAVTIEVSNDSGAPNWHVGDVAIAKLIELCVDICKRNGIPYLDYKYYNNQQIYGRNDTEWKAFKNAQYVRTNAITLHKYFGRTACPGPYLESIMPIIAAEINKKINNSDPNYIYGGLDYSMVFDPKFYLEMYTDLQMAIGDQPQKLFDHFIQYGIKELRVAKASFNIHCYAYFNLDLVAQFGPLNADTANLYYKHYLTYGYKEHRITC